MQIIEKKLWDDENSQVKYTAYLLDNSKEIDENRKRPLVVVCPGGGYLFTSDREAEPIAMMYLNKGYNAVVLRYSVKSNGGALYPKSLIDLSKMMTVVRENADEWNVDSDKIAICGFSAGAHLCATLATQWKSEFLRKELGVENEKLKPNAMVLGYPLLDYALNEELMMANEDAHVINEKFGGSDYDFFSMANKVIAGEDYTTEVLKKISPINYVDKDTAPSFLWHTREDSLVYVVNSLKFGEELFKHKVPFEMHIFENGPHGLSLANNRTGNEEDNYNEDVAKWADLALRFLERRFKK